MKYSAVMVGNFEAYLFNLNKIGSKIFFLFQKNTHVYW